MATINLSGNRYDYKLGIKNGTNEENKKIGTGTITIPCFDFGIML